MLQQYLIPHVEILCVNFQELLDDQDETIGTNSPDDMYPRLSISNKKPSAQITGPSSNLSFKYICCHFFSPS